MKIYLSKLIQGLLIASVLLFAAMPVAQVAAQSKEDVCRGVGAVSGTGSCDPPGNSTNVNSIIASAINLFSIVVGVAAVIMIIIGGLKYIMSSGDSSGVSSAKNTVLFAIIGLAIVAMAQVIVKYVLTNIN